MNTNFWKSTPLPGAVEIDFTKNAGTIACVVIKEVKKFHGVPFKHSIKVKKEEKHVVPWIYFKVMR